MHAAAIVYVVATSLCCEAAPYQRMVIEAEETPVYRYA